MGKLPPPVFLFLKMTKGGEKQEELDFLNEVSCVPLQQGLRHLQTAFTNFFAGRTK